MKPQQNHCWNAVAKTSKKDTNPLFWTNQICQRNHQPRQKPAEKKRGEKKMEPTINKHIKKNIELIKAWEQSTEGHDDLNTYIKIRNAMEEAITEETSYETLAKNG